MISKKDAEYRNCEANPTSFPQFSDFHATNMQSVAKQSVAKTHCCEYGFASSLHTKKKPYF